MEGSRDSKEYCGLNNVCKFWNTWQESRPPSSNPAHMKISGIYSCRPAFRNMSLHFSLLTIGTVTWNEESNKKREWRDNENKDELLSAAIDTNGPAVRLRRPTLTSYCLVFSGRGQLNGFRPIIILYSFVSWNNRLHMSSVTRQKLERSPCRPQWSQATIKKRTTYSPVGALLVMCLLRRGDPIQWPFRFRR